MKPSFQKCAVFALLLVFLGAFDVFFIGDFLMSARLIIIGLFAIIDRFRKRKDFSTPDFCPRVAVLIPAYNEEKVIARTIRSVLMSNYKNIRGTLSLPDPNATLQGMGITHPFAAINQKGALENIGGINSTASDIQLIGQTGIGVEQVLHHHHRVVSLLDRLGEEERGQAGKGLGVVVDGVRDVLLGRRELVRDLLV